MKSTNFLLNSSREYAIYVCETRAIPKIQDGLKNGQRIALWLLRNRAEKLKTFALSGLMGYERLYVHGETSANGAIGLLAAPYKNNAPLIEGLGSFGSRVAPVEGIGAPRYTEVRRSKVAQQILYRDLDLVPLEENYDGSNEQPTHFLPLIPTVLLNGVSGVAVGWSTEILPRSLKDLIEATQAALRGSPIKDLIPHYERYKIDVKSLGDNKYEYYGKAEIVDTSTIRIHELPPGMQIEKFRKFLIDLEDQDSIRGFTDKSTDTIDITVQLKRGAAKNWNEEKAIQFFKLREKITERIVVIDWDGRSIRTYDDPKELVKDFAQWRLGWYTTRFEKMLADAKYELTYWNILELLFKAGFTKKLGTFANRSEMENEVLMVASSNSIVLDGKQMDRVMNLPTYRWTKDFKGEIDENIDRLSQDIEDFETILGSPDLLKQVYLDELEELKKL